MREMLLNKSLLLLLLLLLFTFINYFVVAYLYLL